jgi:inosine-uridine nucleoside N-ribohydrolase
MTKRLLLIDTDPGVDDAMALQFALGLPQFEVLALTTVFGNVPVELATTNALRLLHLAGRAHIPVAQGAAHPLAGTFDGGAPFVHGDDGQGNTGYPPAPTQAVAQPAAELLAEVIGRHPGQVTLVALGPLTNLAHALRVRPSLVHEVAEVVVMGGNAFCAGNATPAAEANVLSDPDAADIVLGAGWPLTLFGLDVTQQVNMRGAVLDELARLTGPLSAYVGQMVPFYRRFCERVRQIDGIYVHDATPLAYLIAPELFRFVHHPVRVDTSPGIGRGKTWPAPGGPDQLQRPALRPWLGRPNVKIAVGVQGSAVVSRLREELLKSNL